MIVRVIVEIVVVEIVVVVGIGYGLEVIVCIWESTIPQILNLIYNIF